MQTLPLTVQFEVAHLSAQQEMAKKVLLVGAVLAKKGIVVVPAGARPTEEVNQCAGYDGDDAVLLLFQRLLLLRLALTGALDFLFSSSTLDQKVAKISQIRVTFFPSGSEDEMEKVADKRVRKVEEGAMLAVGPQERNGAGTGEGKLPSGEVFGIMRFKSAPHSTTRNAASTIQLTLHGIRE